MMNRLLLKTGLVVVMLIGWNTDTLLANDAPPHKGPPPEAVEACSGLEEGDICTVSFDGRSMDGVCRTGPNGESTLACMPEKSGRSPRQPPKEAYDACDGLDEGDACTVDFDGHTMEGTCRMGPDDDELVCVPKHAPGPPPERND